MGLLRALKVGTTRGAIAGTFLAGEMLAGQPSDQYELPATLLLKKIGTRYRFQSADRMLAHGGSTNGHFAEPKEIEIKGKTKAASADAELTLMRAVHQAVGRQDIRLWYRDDCYINVARLQRNDPEPVHLTGRKLDEVSLALHCADPFWYSDLWASHTQTLAGDATFTVTTDNTIFPDVETVIIIQAPTVGSVPSVRLTNTTDASRFLTYQDTSLRDSAVAVIDGTEGTVTRGATNTIRFKGGSFLRLLAGANSFAYVGAACTISFVYQARWL